MLISNQPHLLSTQEYINGCNIQSETARKQLFDFSTGIYSMGIWNNVVFLPMRSSQNAFGSGFVYSLGGLGRAHGQMANDPQWNEEGMIFATDASTGRNSRIDIPWNLFDIRENSTFFAVTNFGDQGGAFLQSYLAGSQSNQAYSPVFLRT